jgi:hypothetical protein
LRGHRSREGSGVVARKDPIAEEGLDLLVQEGLASGRLDFVLGAPAAVPGQDFILRSCAKQRSRRRSVHSSVAHLDGIRFRRRLELRRRRIYADTALTVVYETDERSGDRRGTL